MFLISCILFSIVFYECCKADDSYKIVEALVGQSAVLPCNITAENGDKLNVIAWYKNESSTAFYSYDPHEPSAPSLSGRYRLIFADTEGVSNLQILKVRPGDSGGYHCFADFTSSPTVRTFVQLNVIEPPQRLWVIHENGSQITTTSSGTNTSKNIGPYHIGDKIHLFCVVFGGKPSPYLSWWDDEHELKNSTTILSSLRVRSDLHYGPLRREDHGKVLTCFAANYDEAPTLSISVVIDMFLPPELISIRVSKGDITGRVEAGATLVVQCRVLGARPLPPITWRLGETRIGNLEQNITKEPSQRLVVSEIELCISREFDESLLTCCVPSNTRVLEEISCAPGIPLVVLYPPQLKIISEQGDMDNFTLSVVKGSDVTLNCTHQANPSVYKLVWFHREDVCQPTTQDNLDIQPNIELKAVTEKDAGEYACAATNDVGSEYSQPINVDVTYPPACEDENIIEYGVGESESVNITCNVIGNPSPTMYRWVFLHGAVNTTILKYEQPKNVFENDENTILYQRPNGTNFSTILCFGLNNVSERYQPNTPCTFLVSDKTVPRPPTHCIAKKSATSEITVTCQKSHDGGLLQKFKLIVMSNDEEIMLIKNSEPEFIIQEPKKEQYNFLIVSYNKKGASKTIKVDKSDVIQETAESRDRPLSAVSNITTLSLALCGGVALVALAACGLVLCARDRTHSSATREPPLCAYNTEESNCETCNDSDDSECNVRRTESFRRAVARYPRNYDVRRSSSFHSTRHLNQTEPDRCDLRHTTTNRCRVHSLQNISRKRDIDALCDHLVMQLPPDPGYTIPKPMNTFYTLPKKMHHRTKEINDEASEITQTSDGFSLPPPPDEFSSYRAGTTIRDVPSKPTSAYGTIRKKTAGKEVNKEPFSNVIISPMNTVGLPTISGQTTLYSYPDDRQGTQNSSGILSTFQSNFSRKESGI